MKHFKVVDDKMTCNHPAVEGWAFTGMLAARGNGPAILSVDIVLKSGERRNFKNEDVNIAQQEADNYLDTIN